MKELKNSGIFILLAVLFLSCQQPVTYHVNGWEIISNPKDGTLSFSQTDLGLVLGNVQLKLKNGESPIILKNWKTDDKNGQIILTTEKPEKTKKAAAARTTTAILGATARRKVRLPDLFIAPPSRESSG